MKTISSHIMTGILAALLLSCGSSMERDAKKFAGLQCEFNQKVTSGEFTIGNTNTLFGKELELMDDLESKYRESNELTKFKQQVEKVYRENCK